MKLAGFNFTKISVEKLKNQTEGVKINTNIDISEIGEVKSDMFKLREQMIAISFTNTISYDPEFAKVELAGTMIIGVESKLARDILKEWKDKKIPEEFRLDLFNIIIRKCSVKALELEEDLNLPLHIQMPKVQQQTSSEAPSESIPAKTPEAKE
jgi:hypothetical protein